LSKTFTPFLIFKISTLGRTDMKYQVVETLASKTSEKMLSSSNCSSSQGHSALDMDESGSSTLNSSHFTDETTSASDIRVDIGRKQDNNDKAGTEQPYTYPDNPENIVELATKILQRFGLDKEDLENLLSYPEDLITVTNLPAILRHIYIMKVKKTSDSSNFPRVTSTTGFDRFSCSEGEQIHSVYQNVVFDGFLEETRSSQFVSVPGDREPGQAINDSMFKNDSIIHRKVINVVEIKKNQKSNQEYQKTRSYSDLNPVPPPSMRPTCPAYLPEPTGFNGLPPKAMMEDYTAATPRAFPHTCSLCSIVCVNIKVSLGRFF
uniref:Uncharacterized protein n=1 Tax=Poecilia reticulata TaxID=8081 RepID=A0A3P9PRR6_POERE